MLRPAGGGLVGRGADRAVAERAAVLGVVHGVREQPPRLRDHGDVQHAKWDAMLSGNSPHACVINVTPNMLSGMPC
jgi:hypothetical protein